MAVTMRPGANRRRQRPDGESGLDSRTIGNALVVHIGDRLTDEARALAMSVAPDPEHDLVVVDLPAGCPISMWESVAGALPRKRRGVRLVIGGRSRETTALAGQWLSERLGRPIVAPDGAVTRGANGSLFVHSGQGTGWVRFRPGRPPRWEAKRFPRPSWDDGPAAEHWPTSATGVAEPIPGGVWIRSVEYGTGQREHRGRLVEGLPCQPDVLTIVLGCPGTQPLSLDDVARFWQRLSPEVRYMVRFVQYGPVALPEDTSLGQALADLLEQRIACYAGMPVGSAEAPDVYTIGDDGRLGWNTFARELGYEPESSGPPILLSHRNPVYGVTEVAPAVYWYAPDAVLEVVPSGLWVRPPGDSADPAVRSVPADSGAATVTFAAETETLATRMRVLAEDVLGRLDHATRQLTRLLPSTSHGRSAVRVVGTAQAEIETPPAPETSPDSVKATCTTTEVVNVAFTEEEKPGELRLESAPELVEEEVAEEVLVTSEPGPEAAPVVAAPVTVAPVVAEPVVAEPVAAAPVQQSPVQQSPVTRAARIQPTPESEASALLPRRGLDKERAWLRSTLSQQYEAIANSVARVLSEYPGVQGGLSRSSDEVLTDAVAVRLYLSTEGDAIDQALRNAKPGPHVPFARCVVSGLSRLPSHRGATVFAASPTAEQWKLYRDRRLLTEWGFATALTAPCAGQTGDVDVLMWSMTARRTKLLEPDEDRTEDRVLFVPGTSFKVLDLVEPTGEGRGQILLRELSAAEISPDGTVQANRQSLDELAVTSLRECLQRWADAPPRSRLGKLAAGRFQLPGLV